jgi:hypothetical protein
MTPVNASPPTSSWYSPSAPMRMRGHEPSSVRLSASVLSAPQQVRRPRVWFMPSASAARFCPTTICSFHSRAS